MPSLGIAPGPGGLQQVHVHPAAGAGTGYRRLSGGRPVAPSGDCALGSVAVRHITRAPRPIAPYAWARRPVLWHAIFSFFLSGSDKPSGPGISPPIPPYFVGDMSGCLVAQTRSSTCGRCTRPPGRRARRALQRRCGVVSCRAPVGTGPLRPTTASGGNSMTRGRKPQRVARPEPTQRRPWKGAGAICRGAGTAPGHQPGTRSLVRQTPPWAAGPVATGRGARAVAQVRQWSPELGSPGAPRHA